VSVYGTKSLVTMGKYVKTAASPGESMHPASRKLIATKVKNNRLFIGRPYSIILECREKSLYNFDRGVVH
jgi:hypothetical protein